MIDAVVATGLKRLNEPKEHSMLLKDLYQVQQIDQKQNHWLRRVGMSSASLLKSGDRKSQNPDPIRR